MRKLLLFFVFSNLALFLLNCNEENDILTNPKYNIPSDSVIVSFSPIDSKINIKLTEEINSSNRNVSLFFYTDKIYSLSGSKIISDLIQIDNTFKIELKEIKFSSGGATISVPATVRYDLNELQEGSYILDISINNKQIIGLINVSKESFELKMQPNNIIYFTNSILFRIPKTIIWGEAESVNQVYYKKFLDSLNILGTKPHNLKSGEYFYFEVDSLGGVKVHSTMGMVYGEYFLCNFESDTLITRNLVKRFAKRYMENISIRLLGGRGEKYYSSILRNEPW